MNAVLDKEAWRYSARAWQALHAQEFVAAQSAAQMPASLVERFDWPETRARRIVFVNGAADAASEFRLRDGERLHLVFVNAPGPAASRWEHELTVSIDSGSAQVIEQHIGLDGADVLGEVTSCVRVGAGAHLRATTLCDLPDCVSLHRRGQVAIDANATYSSTHALSGGRFQRHDIGANLAGERAGIVGRGVFALRGRAHVDVHLDVRHAARDTASDVLWRGVADARARGILHGAIVVAPGADGADARLQTKNLLLSPHAEIDAQPVLEIYADEVKASHGATVGQLDERALFYLRSRGVPLVAARNLLIAGFCREAFVALDDADLRVRLDELLGRHMPQSAESAA